MPLYNDMEVIIRIILSGVLGGLIGLERESLNKSAGFRTHILVCVGSALIMVVSQDIYNLYQDKTTMDPARIAAQVVSGIGFLGAGTIMREGATVKGLTTAATLWVVAGVGLAVGAGSYFPALVATGVVFLTLIYLGKVEKLMTGMTHLNVLLITAENRPGQLGRVAAYLGECKILIHNIQMRQMVGNDKVMFEIDIKPPKGIEMNQVLFELADIAGVHQVEQVE